MTTPDDEFMNAALRRKSGRPPPPPMADSNSPMNRILRGGGPGEARSSLRPIDPNDVDRWLDASDFTDEDGSVDEDAKAAAIDALLAEKPYLGTTAPPPPPFVSVAGGPRGAPATEGINMNDVLRGRREARRRDEDDEIRQARSDRLGRLTDTGNDAA